MSNEHDLTDAIRKFLTKEEQAKRCFAIKIHGGKFQRAGIPDWIIFMKGARVLLVETKRPGEEDALRPLQRLVKAKLEALGFPVWIPSTMEEFRSIYTTYQGRDG